MSHITIYSQKNSPIFEDQVTVINNSVLPFCNMHIISYPAELDVSADSCYLFYGSTPEL